MFDGHWRSPIERGLAPIGESLRNAGITADVITVVGIAMAGGAAVAIGAGQLRLGLLLLILTGVPDALDAAAAHAAQVIDELPASSWERRASAAGTDETVLELAQDCAREGVEHLRQLTALLTARR